MVKKLYGRTRTIPHRRKRAARTDYKQRLKLLKGGSPRLVVRRSLRTINAQIIRYNPDGDEIIASANSKDLVKMGWKGYSANTPAAYLVGLLVGKRAMQKKVKEAILDLGLTAKGSKIFATVKGAVDAGLNIPHNPEVLPNEDRIKGKHITDYANTLKADKQEYSKKFSRYTAAKSSPENLTAEFENMKKKISTSQ
jgi:large subunit ribosomal protein L18